MPVPWLFNEQSCSGAATVSLVEKCSGLDTIELMVLPSAGNLIARAYANENSRITCLEEIELVIRQDAMPSGPGVINDAMTAQHHSA